MDPVLSMTKLKQAQLKHRMLGKEMTEVDYQHWRKVDNVECLLKILVALPKSSPQNINKLNK